MHKYKIAGLILETDIPGEVLPANFKVFEVSDGMTDCHISLKDKAACPSDFDSRLITSDILDVFEDSPCGRYTLVYKDASGLICEVSTAASSACIYADGSSGEVFIEAVSVAVRDAFFIFAQAKREIPVHSSSIIYKDKAYLFSAPSGTGKTTHTDLWRRLYGVEILDGDVAMLSLEGDSVYAYGLPWCGTSGVFANKRVKLGAVVFLHRAEINLVSEYAPTDGLSALLARTFAPNWNRELAGKNVNIIMDYYPYIKLLSLECRPDEEAAKVMKDYIDSREL